MKRFTENFYHSSQIAKSSFPTINFFSKFILIVLKNGLLAKKDNYNDDLWEMGSLKVINLLEKVGVEFIVEGLDNLDHAGGPVVIVSNHMSSLETVCLPAILLPRLKIAFIVKKELSRIPFFKHIITNRNSILVSRTNPRIDYETAINQGIDRLKKGISVIVFPQKTRTTLVDFKEFNTLGVKLAQQSNVPIIPLALISDAWSNGPILKDFGKICPQKKVVFSFGAPINSSLPQKEIMNIVFNHIRSKLIQFDRKDLLKS